MVSTSLLPAHVPSARTVAQPVRMSRGIMRRRATPLCFASRGPISTSRCFAELRSAPTPNRDIRVVSRPRRQARWRPATLPDCQRCLRSAMSAMSPDCTMSDPSGNLSRIKVEDQMSRSQLEFRLPTRGGRRDGAGRKPKGPRALVSHDPRPRFERVCALHVTLRVAARVWNLRSQRCFRVFESCFASAAGRFGLRIIEFSVLGSRVALGVSPQGSLGSGRADLPHPGEPTRSARLHTTPGDAAKSFRIRAHGFFAREGAARELFRSGSPTASECNRLRSRYAHPASGTGIRMTCSPGSRRRECIAIRAGPPLVPHSWCMVAA